MAQGHLTNLKGLPRIFWGLPPLEFLVPLASQIGCEQLALRWADSFEVSTKIMGGKWWSCRSCGARNLKSSDRCGFCGSHFVVDVLHMDSSTPQSPANSYQCVDHQGYQQAWGPYGKWLSPAPYHTWGPNGKGKYMDNGKGKGYNADHGKGKSHGAKGGDGKGKYMDNGNGKGSHADHGKGKGQEEKPLNSWEKKKQKRAVDAASKSSPPPAGDSVDVVEDENSEAQDLLDRMDVVQGMINSLSDRSDKYSNDLKSNFLIEMSRLRILKTQLKPLGDQIVVLENLVAKRKDNVQNIQEELDKLNGKLLKAQDDLDQAQDSLADVQNAKVESDAAREAPVASPFLEQAKSMSDLLPKEKQANFTECLKLLHQIMAPDVAMKPKETSTQASVAVAEVNTVSGATSSASGGIGNGDIMVANGGNASVAIGGNGELATATALENGGNVRVAALENGGHGQAQSSLAIVTSDPYSVDLGTPHRARPLRRSASADSFDGRSDRSRTTSGSRQRMRFKQAHNPNKENEGNILCPVETGFSRRESLPTLSG